MVATGVDPNLQNPGPSAIRSAQWRMLLATMFCYLFYYTGRQTFGFAIPGIEKELGLSKEVLGWVSAALLWSYAVGQAINGNLGDRFGGRRMMSLGALLSCVTNWIVSFATGFGSLIGPWAINGYFQSMGWAPGSRVISNWWPRRERGKAFGLYVFAAGISSVLAFVTSLLVLEVFELNWRWIFRLPVLLLLLGGGVYFLVARDRPRDLGLPPIGQNGEEEAEKPGARIVETSLERYRHVLNNWRFMIASLAIGFQNMARYGLLVWVPVYFLGQHYKDSPGGRWISIALPLGMALGSLSSGWISDRLFGSKRSGVITVFLATAAIASMAMFYVPQGHWAAVPTLFLCGFFAYGPQSTFWALAPDLLGTQRAGTGVGVMNACAYAVAGLGEPLIGRVIETNNNNTALVFPIVAVACLIGALTALFIRR